MATELEATPVQEGPLVVRAQAWLRRRWVYAAIATTLFAGVVFALTQIVAGSYVLVARDMLPEDQQAAVTALEAKSIPYKLTATSLSVPEDRLHEARMELAVTVGASGRAPGFELFDNNTMGRSTFSQKVNFRRAMEGELARTIAALTPVDRARVHLVLPERRLFKRDQAAATASVIVTLKRSMLLTKRQVSSIQQLVGGAVEGLLPSQVAVVDQFGQVLARADGTDARASHMIERTMAFERSLEQRVVALLEPTIGRGRVRAKVAARLDFSQLSEHQEKYDPESQTVRSEREKLEKTEGSSKPARGAPGTATNLPTRQPAPANAQFTKPSKADRSDMTKNYVVDRQVTRRQTENPRVQRLSVAVLIDVKRDGAGEVDRPHSAPEIAAYTKLLTTGVGLDPTRGDTIEVASMPFTPELAPGLGSLDLDQLPRDTGLAEYLLYGLAGLGLLLMGVTLFLAIRSRKAAKKAEAEAEAARLEHLEAEARARIDLAEVGMQSEIAQLRRRAVAQSERDVLVTASVIRSWLNSPGTTS